VHGGIGWRGVRPGRQSIWGKAGSNKGAVKSRPLGACLACPPACLPGTAFKGRGYGRLPSSGEMLLSSPVAVGLWVAVSGSIFI
jgi:hypothetical protein